VLTASQCATYDEAKSRLLALTGWSDSLGAHLAASMVTGVVTTTATNPVDVVKVGQAWGRPGGGWRAAALCLAAQSRPRPRPYQPAGPRLLPCAPTNPPSSCTLAVLQVVMFVRGPEAGGPLACAADLLRHEGAGALMKGWSANYARLGPQTVIVFVVAEQLRGLAGLGAL
jgi:solute carrier family 25 uncoupling protein 8/9